MIEGLCAVYICVLIPRVVFISSRKKSLGIMGVMNELMHGRYYECSQRTDGYIRRKMYSYDIMSIRRRVLYVNDISISKQVTLLC